MAKGRPRKKDAPPPPAWAARMALVRDEKGLGQAELGALVGKSQSAITDYERGIAEPDFALVERISAALGVNPGWLMFGVGNREPNEGDAFAEAALRRHTQDKWFTKALLDTARMLSDEGLDADFSFVVLLARKIAQQVDGVADHVEAGEGIRAAVERERVELRAGVDHLRKSRL